MEINGAPATKSLLVFVILFSLSSSSRVFCVKTHCLTNILWLKHWHELLIWIIYSQWESWESNSTLYRILIHFFIWCYDSPLFPMPNFFPSLDGNRTIRLLCLTCAPEVMVHSSWGGLGPPLSFTQSFILIMGRS